MQEFIENKIIKLTLEVNKSNTVLTQFKLLEIEKWENKLKTLSAEA